MRSGVLLVGQEQERKGDLKMKEITLTEEKLRESVAKAVSNILDTAPKDETFGELLIIHTMVGGMIAVELRKILFGGGANPQTSEDLKA